MRITTSVAAACAAIAALLFSGRALAFHDGGVAYCEGCHTMHNSIGGKAPAINGKPQFNGNAHLLLGSDPSSTCLNCHGGPTLASYHVATTPFTGGPTSVEIPANRNPGGDFAWLKLTRTWTYPRSGSNPGDRHGHNIVAADFGYTPDATLATSPGGSYTASNLSCVSCHDPHSRARQTDEKGTIVTPTIGTASLPICGSGSYGDAPEAGCAVGVYRLLGSAGYQDLNSNVRFGANAPFAVAPSTYNRTESATDTRVAYGRGMSLWCANCHSQIHNSSLGNKLEHPSDQTLTGELIANYNAYVKSGDLSGTVASAYSSLVPFEEGDSPTLTMLKSHAVIDGSVKSGADASSRVTCVSCHRAHASAFQSMTRWNTRAEFLVVDGVYAGVEQPQTGEAAYGNYAAGYTRAQYTAAMYDRPAATFAIFQRQLCNKCHAKD